MADTVVKLMDLEGVLQKAILESDSEERKSVLMERLKNVSRRIASSMGI
jgi:hydrogenase maturation factor HypE